MSQSTRARRFSRLLRASVLLMGISAGATALYWFVTFPDVSRLATFNPSTTALMERHKTEATEQGRVLTRKWKWVPLAGISPYLQRAVVAAEDSAFYRHDGFDWEGMRVAAARNLEEGSLRRGGSTITQQVAKNLYLSTERSLLRKAREALITLALEHYLPKKRILEIYLNIAEWGREVYGAEAAARHYFGQSAATLSPEQAALLAAMLPSPHRYDPLRMTPYLAKRQGHILQQIRR